MPPGRWPPNTLFSHIEGCADACAEGCPVAELDRQSGVLKTHGGVINRTHSAMGFEGGNGSSRDVVASVGGASRFFPCFNYEAPFRYQAKAAQRERSAGLDARNAHPTVKPIALMRWLVRLITPPGGTVLDPFAGSGTTGLAAIAEGFDAVLIEREAAYIEIIRKRIAHATAQQSIEAAE